MPKDSGERKAVRRRAVRRRPKCRDCPLCAPSGACRNPAIKSGRCGDWVWYMVGRKQRRRLWAKPRNPRTPRQQHGRRRFGAASRKYSQSLTREQQAACIAAGAKLRCRPRLGLSGYLTGQQYLVRKEYQEQAEASRQNAETASESLQTLRISPSTPGTHRHSTGVAPGQHRRDTGRGRKDQGSPHSAVLLRRRGSRNEEGGRCKGGFGAEVAQHQRLTRPSPVFGRASVPVGPNNLASSPPQTTGSSSSITRPWAPAASPPIFSNARNVPPICPPSSASSPARNPLGKTPRDSLLSSEGPAAADQPGQARPVRMTL